MTQGVIRKLAFWSLWCAAWLKDEWLLTNAAVWCYSAPFFHLAFRGRMTSRYAIVCVWRRRSDKSWMSSCDCVDLSFPSLPLSFQSCLAAKMRHSLFDTVSWFLAVLPVTWLDGIEMYRHKCGMISWHKFVIVCFTSMGHLHQPPASSFVIFHHLSSSFIIRHLFHSILFWATPSWFGFGPHCRLV